MWVCRWWRSVWACRPVWGAGVAAGVAFVFYLVWAELFRIDAICLWCTVVHVSTVVLFAVVVLLAALAPPAATAQPIATAPARRGSPAA